jgi:hypothetical protein
MAGAGAVVGALICFGLGAWIGFIGWEETLSPSDPDYAAVGCSQYSGPCVVQVTYPGVGILLFIFGVILLINGIKQMAAKPAPQPATMFGAPAGPPGQFGAQQWPAPGQRECTNCFAVLPPGAVNCPSCGAAARF